jgi:hypothetical protein
MSIVFDYREPKITYRECLKGTCKCPSAAECKFKRCDNCDNVIDDDGLAIDDGHYIAEHNRCPDCMGDTKPF